jgi:hypothetical protein
MMNQNVFERKRSCPNRGTNLTFAWRDRKATTVRVTDVPAENGLKTYRV